MICIDTIESYCHEDYSKIENYDLAMNDKTQTWECHHRLEISPTGKHFSVKHLQELGLYFNRPANELVFLTKSEHARLHMRNNKLGKLGEGHKRTEETKRRMSLAQKGLRKHSSGRKGKTLRECFGEEKALDWKQKLSEAHKGNPAWNKGLKNRFHWYNNGQIAVQVKECPEGFTPGRKIKNV